MAANQMDRINYRPAVGRNFDAMTYGVGDGERFCIFLVLIEHAARPQRTAVTDSMRADRRPARHGVRLDLHPSGAALLLDRNIRNL